ncbi:glycan-binding surface protein [Mucilaginibacter sp.]|uniref:glycan-binding surface protein n=1 Tax=Mucilaginibacter sp. TaxID=1882438 RepID=UPI0028494AFA|nr:glycan-binding surface protein [Mucilaginibacter sp.]MDR3693224.1 glycan-binding surface protein [Mucilaginibacter sp.]
MKKNLFIRLCLLPLLFAMVALFPACKKSNNTAAPVITDVRNYDASPNDFVLSTGNPSTSGAMEGNGGSYVVIQGSNLKNVTEVDFDGVPASINPAFVTSTNAVIKMPTIDYSTVDTAKIYSITYKTNGGSTTFFFKLGPLMPTITAISNVFANPGDSVYVYGANLAPVKSFSYAGVSITSFTTGLNGASLGFLMPASQPTKIIKVTTFSGTVIDTIKATPTITGISRDDPNPGDSVYVYGTYFKNVQVFTFGGVAITSFTASKDLKSIGFVMPANPQAGTVSVTTKFGTGTTTYNVNDVATGRISDWEWGGNFNYDWWGGSNVTSGNPSSGWPPYNPDFPGNTSMYLTLQNGPLAPGDGNTGSIAIRMDNSKIQWVPTANMGDSPDNWGFKFDLSVPQAWNGSSLVVVTDVSGYIARWEPWNKGATTVAYKTKGWITVTIPLSAFRASDPTLGDGKGTPLTKISDLTGASGKTGCIMYIHNYGSSKTPTGFYGAFDNVRVVKIK